MKKFYLGMDIGTESVGMACTDENYNLLRAKGKDLWAVRLFDKATDASKRRTNRAARRRLQRKKQRIDLLQSVFAPYMDDPLFFIRLNNSGFWEDDKDERLKSRFALFSDPDYTDADFHKNYPTIFHLRNALINGEKLDLRHYYLALHHIIKYRGHFLFDGKNVGAMQNIQDLFAYYNAVREELDLESQFALPQEKATDYQNVVSENIGVKEKEKRLIAMFGATENRSQKLLSLLTGASVKLADLFGEDFKEQYKDEKLSLKNVTDETFEELSNVCTEEHFTLLEKARAIYNFTVLQKVLNGKNYLSEAMIDIYEKHKKDLRVLKAFVKNNAPKNVYKEIFRSTDEKINNYVHYVGFTKNRKGKIRVSHCTREEFLKFLKNTLSSIETDDIQTKEYLLTEIENGTLTPKILNADNGLFPHQINGVELDKILENLCENYPVFSKIEDDGFSPAEKIKSIFTFKIPYYVGPLNTAHKDDKTHGHAWLVKKSNEKILPWNFDIVVDKAASGKEFIRRMTNKCTYLSGQDVLPKGSMYYQAFDVLNQINKLRIGDVPISVELKRELFQNVYLRYKKVNARQIETYLINNGHSTKQELTECPLGGYDATVGLKASMNSYVAFHDKFGDLVHTRPEIFENIILWHTLHTDKNIVKNLILENYGDIAIVQEQIDWLKSLTSFKEFGKLSKKLICEIEGGVDEATGEIYTLLNRLFYTNQNFNELLFSERYTFSRAIAAENSGESTDVGYENVKDLYVSPMVRRGVWQALQMVDEYVAAVGKAPDKIFMETTREDGEKQATVSRKNQLLKLYDGISSDCYQIDELRKQLNSESMTDSRLRQERLYLYFLQLGRCAYTGEQISLDQISTDLYDVDHILPRSLRKDDSLDNKVLVKRVKNEQKSNIYPLPVGFTNQQSFWKTLHDKKCMSDVKYSRLMRTKPLSDEDFRDFENRQLVVTNQTVKAVADLLELKFRDTDTKIVYGKAKNVNDFKQKYDIVKCRETNDFHHARDAYLNIVVGNVYDVKFTCARDYYYRKPNDFWREYNLEKLFDKPIANAWAGESDLAKVKATVQKTGIPVMRLNYTGQGQLFKLTILKNSENVSLPRKERMPYAQTERYGGYDSLATAYFAVVRSKKKKDWIKTIEAIPVLVDKKSKYNPNAVMEYLTASGLIEPNILIPKVRTKSLVSVNGFRCWIAGKTGTQIILHNANEWRTDRDTDLYVKQLTKFAKADLEKKISDEEKSQENIPLTANRKNVTLYATKQRNLELYENVIRTLRKKAYQGVSAVQNFCEKLVAKQSIFENLSTYEQIIVLLQIVRFMKCNAECSDLSLLKDGKGCGKLQISKNITDIDFAIIHQSPCGLYEKGQKV